ncbi:hypothetical protein PQQ86_35460 [Paraburkholderia sediminicola]|uniref:hypothetical protein n=1 Tax=Paraburkholderia sediminicola TaxID=458836 RepID=UPI0038BA7165
MYGAAPSTATEPMNMSPPIERTQAQRVMLSVDHRFGKITLSLDRDYTIAGRPMTKEQIRTHGELRMD